MSLFRKVASILTPTLSCRLFLVASLRFSGTALSGIALCGGRVFRIHASHEHGSLGLRPRRGLVSPPPQRIGDEDARHDVTRHEPQHRRAYRQFRPLVQTALHPHHPRGSRRRLAGRGEVDAEKPGAADVAAEHEEGESLEERGEEEVARESLDLGLVELAASCEHEGEPPRAAEDDAGDGEGLGGVELGVERRRLESPGRGLGVREAHRRVHRNGHLEPLESDGVLRQQ
mmetsp:Transcript_43175/g.91848  ORF Transcript_43175/g.91848 Transcript_43175/m.91848 type:complete len:230 (+) Transcript_43175:87-776(+)